MNKNKILIIAGVIGALIIIGAIVSQSMKPKVTYDKPIGPLPFEGRADAAVVVDEYGDFQCPACKTASPIVQQFIDLYGANVRLNFKQFPLESIHANALNAAMASLCANDQGKFWPMHDKMYERQEDGLSSGNLKSFAKEVGVNEADFNACYDSRARLDQVRKEQAEGYALNINGTPSFVINGKDVVGLRDLEAKIRVLLGLPPLEVKK